MRAYADSDTGPRDATRPTVPDTPPVVGGTGGFFAESHSPAHAEREDSDAVELAAFDAFHRFADRVGR